MRRTVFRSTICETCKQRSVSSYLLKKARQPLFDAQLPEQFDGDVVVLKETMPSNPCRPEPEEGLPEPIHSDREPIAEGATA